MKKTLAVMAECQAVKGKGKKWPLLESFADKCQEETRTKNSKFFISETLFPTRRDGTDKPDPTFTAFCLNKYSEYL